MKINIFLSGLLALLIAASSGCAGLRGAPFVVRDDRVEATIVIADTPTATAKEAALLMGIVWSPSLRASRHQPSRGPERLSFFEDMKERSTRTWTLTVDD